MLERIKTEKSEENCSWPVIVSYEEITFLCEDPANGNLTNNTLVGEREGDLNLVLAYVANIKSSSV